MKDQVISKICNRFIVQYSNSLQLQSVDLHIAVFGLVWFYKESKKICSVYMKFGLVL